MIEGLLNLSWTVQLTLAAGYVGYFVANQGRRSHHQPIDVAFLTLVYGVLAAAVYTLVVDLLAANLNPTLLTQLLASLAAMAVAFLAGAIWRRSLKAMYDNAIRKWSISNTNDDNDALTTLLTDNRFYVTQISVTTSDGETLICDDTAKVNNAPFAPCLVGKNGDIAFYATTKITGKKPKPQLTLFDEHFGTRITYIPAAKISAMNFRIKQK